MSIFNYKSWLNLSPKDWVLHIVSLGLAILLWSFVGGEDIVNKNIMVPVEVINLPGDLTISNNFKKELEVTINGPRSLVLDLGKGEISRQIDLGHAAPGTMVLENSNDTVTVPRGVKVLRVQPKNIILSLDKIIQKQLRVNPVTSGVLAANYLLKDIRMEPSSISITGPQSVLSQFDVLRTKIIDIQGLAKSTEIQVPLELDPIIVDLIGATTITAGLDIVVATEQKKISRIPVIVRKNGQLQRVTPAYISVTVNFPKTLLQQKIDLHSLFTVTAINEQKNGEMQVLVKAIHTYEESITILRIEPETVTLVQEVIPTAPENQQNEKTK